jgi:DNA-directed RNA polymerase specialized sigma24 family protein
LSKCLTSGKNGKKCPYYYARLRCLRCEQEADKRTGPYVHPHITNPLTTLIGTIGTLSDKQRLALLRYIVRDMSFRRLGALLGLSAHTAKKIARRVSCGLW